MILDIARQSCLDELYKIASVDLRGLTAETIASASQPAPPMETVGYDRAKQILSKLPQAEAEMAAVEKTAVSNHITSALVDTAIGAGLGGAAGGLFAKKGKKKKGLLRGALVGGATSLGLHGLHHGGKAIHKVLGEASAKADRKFSDIASGHVVNIHEARKAKAVADLADSAKSSIPYQHRGADKNPLPLRRNPIIPALGGYFAGYSTHLKEKPKEKKSSASSKYEYGRDMLLKMLAGAGAGTGLANIRTGATTRHKLIGAGIGATAFGLDHVISKNIAKKREEDVKAKAVGLDPQDKSSKLAAMTPAGQLATSSRIGVPTGKRIDGISSIKKFTPKV